MKRDSWIYQFFYAFEQNMGHLIVLMVITLFMFVFVIWSYNSKN